MEEYYWEAETTTGKIMNEKDNAFADILSLNREGKIKYFMLVPTKPHFKKYAIKLGGKREIIFFRRRMNYVSNRGTFSWTLYILGWKDPVRIDGNLTKLYKSAKMFVYPNGNVEMNNDEPTLDMDYHNYLIQKFENLYPSDKKNEI